MAADLKSKECWYLKVYYEILTGSKRLTYLEPNMPDSYIADRKAEEYANWIDFKSHLLDIVPVEPQGCDSNASMPEPPDKIARSWATKFTALPVSEPTGWECATCAMRVLWESMTDCGMGHVLCTDAKRHDCPYKSRHYCNLARDDIESCPRKENFLE